MMQSLCASFRSLSLSIGSKCANIDAGQLAVNYLSRRFGRRYRKWHHWPNDFLPFKWERPVTDPPYLRTDDSIRDIGIYDPKALVIGAEHSKELQNAPEVVRRQFSLEFAERPDIVAYQNRKIISQVQRHPFDFVSPEVRIANFTVRIRNNLHHFTKVDKYDAPRKMRQNTLVNKRNSFIKNLYYQDRSRYEFITRTLGISFKPPKLGEVTYKPTRKGELRRLTKEYCEKLKDEKLDKYHAELKQKQLELEAEIQEIVKTDGKFLGLQSDASKTVN